MALRSSAARLGVTSAGGRALSKRWQSTASAASKDGIEASLSNPDPLEDSPAARIVEEQLKYMVPTYVRPTPMFQRGQGSYLWDTEGRKYLDLTAGIAVNSLGHCDEDIASIIHDQAKTLMHTSNLYHNPWTGALSTHLVRTTLSTGAMHTATRAFVCNSGSEANEAALKFARKVGKVLDPSGQKVELVSFHNSFHGRTFGSLSATPTEKYQKPFGPMVPGFRYGKYNDIEGIEKLVTGRTCGIIIEPIQGEGGVHAATPEFLVALAKRAREVGAVLIYDEIQCGMGRTGDFWAHAQLPKEAHPDIITTAKALGNGFPVGATVVNDFVSSRIQTGDHGTTFGGNPLASRVAHHIVSRLSDPELLNAVGIKEKLFRAGFQRLQQRWPEVVKEIRGRGLILGLQLDRDPSEIVKAARERGLLVITAGTNTLRFVPPLTISEAEIENGLQVLEEAIESVIGK